LRGTQPACRDGATACIQVAHKAAPCCEISRPAVRWSERQANFSRLHRLANRLDREVRCLTILAVRLPIGKPTAEPNTSRVYNPSLRRELIVQPDRFRTGRNQAGLRRLLDTRQVCSRPDLLAQSFADSCAGQTTRCQRLPGQCIAYTTPGRINRSRRGITSPLPAGAPPEQLGAPLRCPAWKPVAVRTESAAELPTPHAV